jgi:hypothetical protein
MLAACVTATPAGAEDAQPIQNGPEGLVAVPFTAGNAGDNPIACAASLAHWFSLDLGGANQGKAVETILWFDPNTGETFLLNDVGDRMPVETLWCGFAGRSWATRSVVNLERRAGAPPPPIRLSCAPDGDRLLCR